jgi:hypothetical protein
VLPITHTHRAAENKPFDHVADYARHAYFELTIGVGGLMVSVVGCRVAFGAHGNRASFMHKLQDKMTET